MDNTIQRLCLTRSPLVLVLAQVRFSAVTAIAKYIPDIQERLRHKGFPRYLKGQVQEFRFDAGGPRFLVAEHYEFQDKNGASSIILTSDFVVLQTSRYGSYEEFEETLKTTLEIIHDVVSLNLVERVGLRYVNWIRLASGEQLSEYLRSGLLGLDPTEIGASQSLTRFEFVGTTEVGKIVVRFSQQNDGTFLPPDLAQNSLVYTTKPDPNEPIHLLDLDHFSERPGDFAVPPILNVMGQLHNNLEMAFRHAVTPEALVIWGNKEAS